MDLKRSAVSDLINYRTSIYHRIALLVSFSVLWITGVAWLVIDFLNLHDLNFLRTIMMKIHGAAVIIFILVFGALWLHFTVGFVTKLRVKSGLALFSACVILIITGWVLYYQPQGLLRSTAFWAHIIIGIFVPVIFLLHVGNKIRILLKKKID